MRPRSWLSPWLLAAVLATPIAAVAQQPEVVTPGGDLASERTTPPAAATGVPVSEVVSLRPGATCLEEARLEAQVARWLERGTVDRRIRVEVIGGDTPTDVRFILHRTGGEPAERVLEAPPDGCDNLTAALALSIALAIDAAILEHFSAPDDEALVEVEEPEPSPGLLDSMLPEPARHRFALSLGLSGGLTTGLVTATAPAGRLSLHGLVTPWLEVRLSGLYTRAKDQRLAHVPGITFDAEVWAGRADLCAVVPATSWLVATGCSGFQGGVFVTQPREGFTSPGQRVGKPLWAVGLGIEARLVLARWFALALYADLSLPLVDRALRVRNANDEPIGDDRKLLPAGVMAGAGPVFRLY